MSEPTAIARAVPWRRWGYGLTTVGLLLVILFGLFGASPPRGDRVHYLATRLRCPVCQGESVAESPSQTARDINASIAEQVAAGRTDRQILDFFRKRYGDWVLLDPPLDRRTILLWASPVAALAVGAAVVLTRVRRRGARDLPELDDSARAIVEAERARLGAAVLEDAGA